MNRQKIISAVLLILTVAFAIASYILLPETVITQLGTSGATTMPKIFAVALPTIIGAGGAIGAFLQKNDEQKNYKPLIISAVGIAVFVIMLLVNLL